MMIFELLYNLIPCYIAVHPWLMSLREDIIQAMVVIDPGPITTPEDAPTEQWMVGMQFVPDIHIDTRRGWLEAHTPIPPMNPLIKQKIQEMKLEQREFERKQRELEMERREL